MYDHKLFLFIKVLSLTQKLTCLELCVYKQKKKSHPSKYSKMQKIFIAVNVHLKTIKVFIQSACLIRQED